jgi:Tfp pilus assembly protein PilN
MIQFNLLPDVKLEYIKARKLKRMVVIVSSIVAGSALTLMILLFLGVAVFQKSHLNNLSKDINSKKGELTKTQDLDKILTIQQQLNSLPKLHDGKPVVSRLFPYIQQVTPKSVSIDSLDVDFASKTMKVSGAADSISTINTFVDTLKFTNFKTSEDKDSQASESKNAFSSVVLVSFGKDDKGSSYQISLNFDPSIFDGTLDVALSVPPGKITTRSETEKPAPLFEPNKDSTKPQDQ